MRLIYLDNHSGTKLDPRVYDEIVPYLTEYYGNAQSMHSFGYKSTQAIQKAREQVAQLINANDNEIYFTSCGSESNNLALKGIAEAYKSKSRHIITSSIEHVSVLNALKRLEQAGYEITRLPVDKSGMVCPDDLKQAIRKDTILVSIQHANPEIGTIQPIEELSKIARDKGVLFHTDAIATTGIIPVDVNQLGIDLLSLAGSQFHGPKGAAALYIRKGVRIIPQIEGGVQEQNKRAGTENIAVIVGLGRAAEIARQEMSDNHIKMTNLRNKLIKELPEKIPYIYLNGHPQNRLPHNVNFSVEFIEGEGMLLFLDEKGIYITSGSACTSKTLKMSHVMSAIECDPAIAQGSVTMTLSKYNTEDDIDYVLQEFPPIVQKLRDLSPLYAYFKKTGKRQEAGPGTNYEHDHDLEE
ncbi:MAG: IscS subfamily cysteine desulfurase [Candidatus Latescibacteria bacterium]|nr:IscS subfamily cysteine desulfurase [Candidatus Latescibacterota bacterium]